MAQRFGRFPLCSLLVTLLGLLAPTLSTGTEVYKSVDKQGKPVFSDSPATNAEPVEIRQPNTSQSIEFRDRKTKTATTDGLNYNIDITSPSNGQIFPNRLQPITVTTQVSPALANDQRLRLRIDGTPHSVSSGSFTIQQLSIGEHVLLVDIIAADDTIIASSNPITIFSRQPGH